MEDCNTRSYSTVTTPYGERSACFAGQSSSSYYGNGFGDFDNKLAGKCSQEPGETFVSVPLLSRRKLVGAINLIHQQPRIYSSREVKLFSTIGFLLGSEIGRNRVETVNSGPVLVERGKNILRREFGISAKQADIAPLSQCEYQQISVQDLIQPMILRHTEAKFLTN